MEVKKPKYPIVLIAYRPLKNMDAVIKREIIHDEIEEENFRDRYSHNAKIKTEQPKSEDYSHLSKWEMITKNTPKWVYIAIGVAGGQLVIMLLKKIFPALQGYI
ncbi:hypothetical protein WG954_17515 [Lacibacter sp. H375]|uniref:hypothetical protein n=1 Tax=Lacibacter sp. H375 TaxID=3133424 RepID=UPI0030BDE829